MAKNRYITTDLFIFIFSDIYFLKVDNLRADTTTK